MGVGGWGGWGWGDCTVASRQSHTRAHELTTIEFGGKEADRECSAEGEGGER